MNKRSEDQNQPDCETIYRKYKTRINKILNQTTNDTKEHGFQVCKSPTGKEIELKECDSEEAACNIPRCKTKGKPQVLIHTHPGDDLHTPNFDVPEEVKEVAWETNYLPSFADVRNTDSNVCSIDVQRGNPRRMACTNPTPESIAWNAEFSHAADAAQKATTDAVRHEAVTKLRELEPSFPGCVYDIPYNPYAKRGHA